MNIMNIGNHFSIAQKNRIGFPLLSIFYLLFLIGISFGLEGSIQPARAIYYPNITLNQINIVNGSVIVKNNNNISVQVFMSSSNNVDVEIDNFTLQPNENKIVNYKIFIWEAKEYELYVSASFSAEGFSVGVGSDIIVFPNSTGNAQNQNPPSKPQLISPLNESLINQSRVDVVFEWSNSTDSDSQTIAYILEISNNPSFSSSSAYSTLKNYKKVSLNDGKWYWRVKSFDGKNYNLSETRVLYIGNYNSTTTTTTSTVIPTTTTILGNSPTTTTSTTIPSNVSYSTTTTTIPTTTTTSTTIPQNYGGGSSGGSSYSSGGGSSSSESFSVSSKEIKKILGNIAKNTKSEAIISENIEIKKISLISRENVNRAEIIIKTVNESEVPERLNNVFKYFEIRAENLSIDTATITFEVQKSWANNFKKVLLMRYNESKWNPLETNLVNETNDNYIYEAKTPGFSFFAIFGSNEEINENFSNERSESIIGSIRPPRMILRCEAPCNLTGWVEVSNQNPYKVVVKTQRIGDFYESIVLSLNEFLLEPNESKKIDFVIPVKNPGEYTSEIIFIFYSKEKNLTPLALASEIIIIANQSSTTSSIIPSTPQSQTPLGMLIAHKTEIVIAIIILIVALLIWLKKRREESPARRKIKQWMKKNSILVLMFFVFLANISFGFNIAVIVKNSSYLDPIHEAPVISLLNNSGYNVTLFDSISDFSNYSALIVIEKECFTNNNLGDFAKNLPVNEKPTVAIGCAPLTEWGWVKSGGMSNIFSSSNQNVFITGSHFISNNYSGYVYVHFSPSKTISGLDEFKTNLIPVAVNSETSKTRIIAYAEANSNLYNNKINKERIVFFGVTYSLYWTNEAKDMFLRAVKWIIDDEDRDNIKDRNDLCPNTQQNEKVDSNGCSCSQKSCDDNIECTIDYCNSENAECIHELNHAYCFANNGWYNLTLWKNEGNGCTQRKIIREEKRSYYCSLEGCKYTIEEFIERKTNETRNKEGCNAYCDGDILKKEECVNENCSSIEADCSQLTGWYDSDEFIWNDINYTTQRKLIKKEYREYYCGLNDCIFNVSNYTFIETNETRIRPNGLVLNAPQLFIGNRSNYVYLLVDDGEINKTFSGVRKVSVINPETSRKVLEFYFNFNESNLDLKNVSIRIQENNSRGFIIVSGLKSSDIVNQSKTIWLKRNLNTNTVCIKDSEISNINEISNNCNSENEFLIKCDGSIYNINNTKYSCLIENGYYKVSGLRNSGVIEIETCNDGIKNQGEEGIDCGGPCNPCQTTTLSSYSSIFKRLECSFPNDILINKSDQRTFNINTKNVGNVALYNVKLIISGINSSWFYVIDEFNKINENSNATFRFSLKPEKEGDYKITLTIYDSSSTLCSKTINLSVKEVEHKIGSNINESYEEKPIINITLFEINKNETNLLSNVKIRNFGSPTNIKLILLTPEGWTIEPNYYMDSILKDEEKSYSFYLKYPENSTGIFSIIARVIYEDNEIDEVYDILLNQTLNETPTNKKSPTGFAIGIYQYQNYIIALLLLIPFLVSTYYFVNNILEKRAVEEAHKKYKEWLKKNKNFNGVKSLKRC
jgi:PGF-pre-PGF domain-containing protein